MIVVNKDSMTWATCQRTSASCGVHVWRAAVEINGFSSGCYGILRCKYQATLVVWSRHLEVWVSLDRISMIGSLAASKSRTPAFHPSYYWSIKWARDGWSNIAFTHLDGHNHFSMSAPISSFIHIQWCVNANTNFTLVHYTTCSHTLQISRELASCPNTLQKLLSSLAITITIHNTAPHLLHPCTYSCLHTYHGSLHPVLILAMYSEIIFTC